jgi:hypothetical protein
MKTPGHNVPPTPQLVQKLFNSGTLRRAGVRQQPARFGRGVDSWLLFGLTRMGSPEWGRGK